MTTISQWITTSANKIAHVSDTPHLDVSILARKVCLLDTLTLAITTDTQLNKQQIKKLTSFLTRRLQGEPIAYIDGEIEGDWCDDCNGDPNGEACLLYTSPSPRD